MAVNRALRQTASWDMAGNGMSGSGGSISSSSSEGRQSGDGMREGSRRSNRSMRSSEGTLGDAPEEEEESWSSDYSASDEEEDQETFSESTEVSVAVRSVSEQKWMKEILHERGKMMRLIHFCGLIHCLDFCRPVCLCCSLY